MNQPSLSDRLLLGMISGLDAEKVARQIGVPPDEVPVMVAEARRRLTVAADYNRDEQLGTAISRLNDCYAKALSAGEVKTCVQVQKELNRLLDLYRPTVRHVDTSNQAAADLAAVRAHLMPLKLGPEDSTTPELARLAVARIVNQSYERRS